MLFYLFYSQQSLKKDEKVPSWNHVKCFLEVHRVKSVEQIENFEGIKYDDQVKLLMKFSSRPSLSAQFETIARKRAEQKPIDPSDVRNFGVEYSTSNDDKCWVCREQIPRTEIRIKKIDFNSKVAAQFGKEIIWNHLHCFIEKREMFEFLAGGDQLPGFASLKRDHKKYIREVLP